MYILRFHMKQTHMIHNIHNTFYNTYTLYTHNILMKTENFKFYYRLNLKLIFVSD